MKLSDVNLNTPCPQGVDPADVSRGWGGNRIAWDSPLLSRLMWLSTLAKDHAPDVEVEFFVVPTTGISLDGKLDPMPPPYFFLSFKGKSHHFDPDYLMNNIEHAAEYFLWLLTGRQISGLKMPGPPELDSPIGEPWPDHPLAQGRKIFHSSTADTYPIKAIWVDSKTGKAYQKFFRSMVTPAEYNPFAPSVKRVPYWEQL